MQHRKIIQLLTSFSKGELKSLTRFICSPYFNKNQKLIDLYAYLFPFGPTFESTKLTESGAYKHLFGNEPYNESRLDRLFHMLFKLVEKFIEHESLQQNPEVGFTLRLGHYIHRNQSLFLEQQLKAFRQWLKTHPPQHYPMEYARFILERTQSNFLHRQTQYNQEDVNLTEAMNALDQYYLVEKLQLASTMYNRQAIISVAYQPSFIDCIISEMQGNIESFPPIVQIWYFVYCLVKNPDSKEIYFQLKNILLDKLDLLNAEDGLALISFLQNSVPKAITHNSPIYFQEYFDLYQVQIQQNWLLSPTGTILENVFKNIVTVGTKIGKIEWTKEFIASYQDCLETESREDMLAYSHGLLAFTEKRYKEALKLSFQASQRNIFLALSCRRLQLKIYYEQEDWELLFSNINSFRVYLHRLTKLSPRHKEVNISFLNFLNKLAKLHHKQATTEKYQALHLEVKNTSLLPERYWLLEKTSSL